MRSRIKLLYNRLFASSSRSIEKFAEPRVKVVIEFIGPPGVGKTTLKNAVLNQLQLKLHDKSEVKYLRNGVSNDCPYWELLRMKIEKIEGLVSDVSARFKALDFFIREIKIESEIRRDLDTAYIMDEGLCHNFNSELLTLTDEGFQRCIENRLLIYLCPDNPRAIVDRLLHRSETTNQVVFYHHGKKSEELEALTRQSVENLERFISRFRNFSSNILVLNADDSLEKNRDTTIDYLMKLA